MTMYVCTEIYILQLYIIDLTQQGCHTLRFSHWSFDGSTFIAQAPQFSWTTQLRNGYGTVCVDTRRTVGLGNS